MFLRQLDQRVEVLRRVDGHFAEHFSIQLDVRHSESVDETAVVHVAHTTGGREARHPQRTEVALAPSADESKSELLAFLKSHPDMGWSQSFDGKGWGSLGPITLF